ncbi:MAG TPA: hypothetical protein VGD78_17430, partial [Chthoniobacterales bacterium]
ERLRKQVGRGSLTTLLRLRNELLKPETPEPETSPEAQASFRQVWQTAFDAGRGVEASKAVEARAEVDALAKEAERLEAQATDLERQLDDLRRSQAATQEETATAHLEAKDARAAFAAEQAKATAGERDKGELLRQLADLERSLGDEKGKAIRFEGKVDWLQEQVKEGERRATELRQALQAAQAEAAMSRQEVKEAQATAAAEQTKVAEREREKADLHRQIASLEHALGQEKGRASKLEGRLEVMEAQVVPSTSAEMKAKLARKGIGGRPE